MGIYMVVESQHPEFPCQLRQRDPQTLCKAPSLLLAPGTVLSSLLQDVPVLCSETPLPKTSTCIRTVCSNDLSRH